jgi:hypothetical protein
MVMPVLAKGTTDTDPSIHFLTGTVEQSTLFDIPDFDDTYLSDTQVLKKVAWWLGAAYSVKIKLAGIIYLHRIIDDRMGNDAFRNLFLFQKICGTSAFSECRACDNNVIQVGRHRGGQQA